MERDVCGFPHTWNFSGMGVAFDTQSNTLQEENKKKFNGRKHVLESSHTRNCSFGSHYNF